MKYPKMFSKISSKTLYSVVASAFVFLLPTGAALAAPVITEIMYDAPGTNAGHQWIEVTNTGGENLDLAAKDLRFFDKSGAHTILASGGLTVLVPGAFAILADKPAIFLADHPGFSGTLLDSVVSLTASDTIGFKNTDGTVLSSISYTSAEGAKGDGNTLHVSGNSMIVGAANPGASGIPAAVAKPQVVEVGTNKSQPSQPAYGTGTIAPTLADTPAKVGAALAASPISANTSHSVFSDLLSSVWFALFLALLVFSGASLILIRKHV